MRENKREKVEEKNKKINLKSINYFYILFHFFYLFNYST